jgi:hypoxanthine phosphoribosyltransferase
MNRIRLKDKEFELFIPQKDIQAAIARVADEIRNDIEGTNPLFVGILNGAFMFIADLMRRLNGPYELTFARYSSYRGTSSGGEIREIMPIRQPVAGRSLILLEDIIDTGLTMRHVMDTLRRKGAKEVKLATMLFKPAALAYDLRPDYVGIVIPNDFIVGYGLDYDELGRAYNDIYRIVEDELFLKTQ